MVTPLASDTIKEGVWNCMEANASAHNALNALIIRTEIVPFLLYCITFLDQIVIRQMVSLFNYSIILTPDATLNH